MELLEEYNWYSMVGQDALVQNLRSALAHQKISHAYLLEGEKESGKKMLADIFARALQCEADEARPCNQCRACKQALHGNHPDIIYVSHEKANTISVDNVRTQINADISIKPYSGKYKVYIVEDAQLMNVQAQNAVLKTLEEPPEYAVIMLLTTNVQNMLSTISSRCVTLKMKPVAEELIKRYLMEKMEIPDYRASVCASFARGNLGRAIQLAANEEFDQMKNDVLNLVKTVKDMEVNQMAALIKKINELKYDSQDFLDLCLIWYRDVLLYKAGGNNGYIIFKEEVADIQRVAQRCSYESIQGVIEALEQARLRLKSNVNYDLTMELLFMEFQKV